VEAAQKLLGVLTIGGGECPGMGWWWRKLKPANKPQCQLKYTKMVLKTGAFPHYLASKSPKMLFLAQKYLGRYSPKMLLRID
jgi:hypothetical protein